MYILQVSPLQLQATGKPESLVAVARSDSLEVLSSFVQSCLSLAEDGVTIKHYESTMVDDTGAVIQCTKVFRAGSPLENFAAPIDREMLIIDLATLAQRIDALTRELEERVNTDWTAILNGVVDIPNDEVARHISASDL